MSDIGVDLPFGGEDRRFRLGIGQWRAIDAKRDVGPMELMRRLAAGTYRLDDVREVFLQGLIGGGMADSEATKLVKATFDDRPVQPFIITAQAVVAASVVGVPDDPVGETTGESEAETISPEAASASPPSTDRARQSE